MSPRAPRFVALRGGVGREVETLRIEGPCDPVCIEGPAAAVLLPILAAAGRVVPVRALQGRVPPSQRRAVPGLVRQLIAVGALQPMVPALERLRVMGERGAREALAEQLRGCFLPERAPKVRVVLLGALSSAAWRRAVGRYLRPGPPLLPISWEREWTWVGPVWMEGQPCPTCLALRRHALGEPQQPEPLALPPRPFVALAATVLAMADGLARGEAELGQAHFVGDGGSSAHPLLASSHCERCVPRRALPLEQEARRRKEAFQARWSAPDAPETPPETQERFRDRMLGVLTASTLPVPGGFRGLPLVIGGIRTLRWTPEGLVPLRVSNNLCGSGFSLARRERVRFCEGLERLALLSQRPDLLAVEERSLGERAVSPTEVVGFGPEQLSDEAFPYARYQGQPLDWAFTYELTRGECRLLPFDALAVGRPPEGRKRRLMDEPFYTGGATHVSLRRAVAHALLELVERDAFMLAWYLRLPLPELRVPDEALSAEAREALEFLRRADLAVRFFDLAVDFDVPCVLAMAEAKATHGRWPRGGRVLSGCAGLTAVAAAERAIGELLGQHTAVVGLHREGDAEESSGADQPDWQPVFERYLKEDASEAFSFLSGPPRALDSPRDLPRGAEASEWLVSQLSRRGLLACVRPLDGPDIRASGLSVVKVVVPTLLRPSRRRAEVNFGSPRLAQVAARWGVPLALSPFEHPQA